MVHFLLFTGGIIGIMLGNHEQYFAIGCVLFLCFLSFTSDTKWLKKIRAFLASICLLFFVTIATAWSPRSGEYCFGYITKKYAYGGEVSVYKCSKGVPYTARIIVNGVGFSRAELYTCIAATTRDVRKDTPTGVIVEDKPCQGTPWYYWAYYAVLRMGYDIRKQIQERAVSLSSEDVGTLGISILLGADGVNTEIKDRLKYLGILHIMAISGINIRYLLTFVQFILGHSSVKVRELCMNAVLAILYILAGPAISLMRAIVSVLCAKFLRFCGMSFGNKEIYLALWLLLLIDTKMIESYSYILVSFACLGIYIIAPGLLSFLPQKIKLPITQEIISSVAVSGVMLPVQYWLFGTVTWLSGVVTLILSPLVEVITIAGYVSLIFMQVPIIGDRLIAVFLQLVAILLFLVNVSHEF
jgi:ComEC/Rec2-related protein